MKRILHFKVHPNIIDLPRSMFWYEDKQAKALDMVDAISSGALTINQTRNLLNGDAYFITEDNGKTLTLVEEEDKRWKKELTEHIEFLEKRKIQLEKDKKEQEKILEKDNFVPEWINDQKKDFIAGYDNTMEELTKQANLDLAKQLFINKFTSKDPLEIKSNNEMIKNLTTKIYDFTFKGHDYKFKHSARNQSSCPHCDAKASDFCWSSTKDKEAYIGKKQLTDEMYALCFECPKCFNKFYYHKYAREIEQEEKINKT